MHVTDCSACEEIIMLYFNGKTWNYNTKLLQALYGENTDTASEMTELIGNCLS